MVIRDPEDMPVMRLARRLDGEVTDLLRRFARQMGRDLEAQIRRAMNSVILNIAEGAARQSPGQKAYLYGIAQGSAGELSSAFTILIDRGITTAADISRPRSHCIQLIGQLGRLARYHRAHA